MIQTFSKRINAAEVFTLQQYQYSDKLVLADTVPAGQSKLGKVSVSNLGHFMALIMTGHFNTLRTISYTLPGGGAPTDNIIDDGVSHLRGLLIDGNGQRKLFNDYAPLDLWLSPGRVKFNDTGLAVAAQVQNNLIPALDSVGGTVATVAASSNSLFYPVELNYLFSANSDILLDVKNDSNTAISYEIVFTGIRILAKASVAGI